MCKRMIVVGILALAIAWPCLAIEQPLQASLIQIIATPEKFDGKVVSVIGFLELDHESSILYMRNEDSKHSILMNGVWLDRNEIVRRDMAQLNLKYVKVVGIFRVGLKNAGFLAGGITDVRTCVPWSDPEHPRNEKYQNPLKSHSNQ
jgi:hypothetical protein